MKLNATSLLSLSTIAIATFFFVSSCSKKNDGPSSGIAASVNGTAFTPAHVYALDLQGGISVTGYTISGTDSSAVYVQFDDTVSLNKSIDISGASDGLIGWTSKSNEYDSWSINSHGTLIVTTLDKTNKKVAGTFTGVLYDFSGNDSVKVTNGTFNSAYIVQ